MTYDPMTGQPIEDNYESAGGYDPMTGQPIMRGTAPRSSKHVPSQPGKIALIIGGIAVVVIVIIGGINSGAFLGKSSKVLMAVAKTFKDTPQFIEPLQDAYGILGSGKFTLGVSGTYYGIECNAGLRFSSKEKQIYAECQSDDGDEAEMLLGIDDKEAKVSIPALSEYVLTYNYKEKSDGYLTDIYDTDDLDETLESLANFSMSGSDDLTDDIFAVVKKEFKSMKFTKADKEEYEVNDKDVRCKGYTATITGENVVNIADGIEDAINDYVSENKLDGDIWQETVDNISDVFDDLRDEADDMDDMEITFYLYKGQLAAILLESDDSDDEIELGFKGGDYRMQNMYLKINDEKWVWSGKNKDGKESCKFKKRGSDSALMTVEYDSEDGDFDAYIDGFGYLSGIVKKDGSTLNGQITQCGWSSLDYKFTLSKGVKMDKYDGKEFDLGNADEDDWADLADEITDELYDNDMLYKLVKTIR